MGYRLFSSLLAVGLLAGLVAGCTSSPEPGVTAKLNQLETRVQGNPEQVASAANEVLKEMDLFVISSRANRLDGRVIARSGTDRRLTIDLKNVGEDRTEVSLQGAGNIFRDSGLGLSILSEIRERTGNQAGQEGEPMQQPAQPQPEQQGQPAEPGQPAETEQGAASVLPELEGENAVGLK